MLNKLTLRARLTLIVAAAILGMVLIALLSAFNARSAMLDAHKEQIRTGVHGMFNIVSHYQSEAAAGKLSEDDAKRMAAEAIRRARYGGSDGKTEYYYIWTMDGVSVAHARSELEGKNMADKIKDGKGNYTVKHMIAELQNANEAFVETEFPRPGSNVPIPKLQFVMKFPQWGWMIGTGVYLDTVDEAFRRQLFSQLGAALVPILLIGLLSLVVSRSVLGQIGGEPARAAEVMKLVADGDLTTGVGDVPKGSLLHDLGTMIQSLRQIMNDIRRDAGSVVHNAERISASSHEVAEAAQQQADATSSMAAAIEELTVSSNHISDNANDTEQNSKEALSLAGQGAQRVEQATSAIQQIAGTVSQASDRIRALDERANQISTIAAVIKDIAGQTNLLALNAAIEAARAGEQGRGFAVVADEVRKLAERTSTATTEIEQMISGIQHDTVGAVEAMKAALPEVDQGAQLANAAADALSAIEQGATQTLDRIREVADATREQSVASTSIAQRVEQIASMVEETSRSMAGMAEAAESLENVAVNLDQIVSRFKT